jgi:hypothetical protein
LRSLNGLLVSAVRRGGNTSFVSLEAVVAGTFLIQVKSPGWRDATPSTLPPAFPVTRRGNSTEITLRKGQGVTLFLGATPPDLDIGAVAGQDAQYERFGFTRSPSCMSLQCAPYWPFTGPKEQCIMPPNDVL